MAFILFSIILLLQSKVKYLYKIKSFSTKLPTMQIILSFLECAERAQFVVLSGQKDEFRIDKWWSHQEK